MWSNSKSFASAYREPYANCRSLLLWFLIEVFERVGAAVAFTILLPGMIVLGVTIGLMSNGSPLVSHKRVGRYGKTLWIPKFRTMWQPGVRNSKEILMEPIKSGREQAISGKFPEDLRISSRIARICRRFSIDELPQLFLVITGQMSLVGPRPLTRDELDIHYGHLAEEVLRKKLGLTGMWQVNGRNHLSYEERVRMDVEFVRNYTPATYFRILARTPAVVLLGIGAW